jgi:hypothetical protein
MDAYAKIVLTVIAACLLLQVAQGFGLLGAPACGKALSSGAETGGQYSVQAMPRDRVLVRLDAATGRSWTMPMQTAQQRFWTEVAESPPASVAREEGQGPPARPAEIDVVEE